MVSGIYQIICLKTKKKYIRGSINIESRWAVHQSQLNNNIHGNRYLQNAWNRYGEEYFEFSILEECEKKDLKEMEQYYIDYIQPEFNINNFIYYQLGTKRSIKTRYKKK